MARIFAAATLSRLREGYVGRHDLLLFDFPPPHGLVGFYSGTGTLTWQGVSFVGAGTLFTIAAVGGGVDGTAVPLTIRLNGDARSGLDATVLAQIEQVQYRGRPVTLWRQYLAPDSYAEIGRAHV